MSRTEKIRAGILLILFVAVLSFFGHRGDQKNYWGNPNEKSRIYSAVSLIETGNFNFEPVFDRAGKLKWPWVIDRAKAPSGKVYSDKAPLTVLLSIPCYLLLKPVFWISGNPPDLYTTVVWMRICQALIPFLILLFFLYKILRVYVDESTAWLSLFLLAFGTMAFSFSFLAFGHTLAGMFLVLSLYCILVKRNLFLSGLFAGLGAITEFSLGAMVLFLFIYLVSLKEFRSKSWRFCLGVLPSLLVLGIYNWALWGSPLAISYQFVPNTGTELSFYRVSLRQILGALLTPSRGLFFYSPVLLFAVYGFVRFYKEQKREALLLISAAFFYLFFMFGFKNYQGGWSPGMRHLITLLPLWIIALAFGIRGLKERRSVFRYLLYAAAAMSLFFNILPGISQLFYPDLLPNPHYFTGLLWCWDRYIYPLRLGEWTGFIQITVFLFLLGSLLVLAWKQLVRIRVGLKGAAVFAGGFVLAVVLAFLPLNYDTMELFSFGYIQNQYYEGLNLWERVENGCHGKIRSEFPENRKIAELAMHRVALRRGRDYREVQKWYDKYSKLNPPWFKKIAYRVRYRIRFLKKTHGDNLPAEITREEKSRIQKHVDELKKVLKKEKSRRIKLRITEYFIYAYAILGDDFEFKKYRKLYQGLKAERLW